MATKIIGLKRLNAKLKKLPKAAEMAVKEAMEQGANEIVAMMKSLVAVDSGDLRDSIGWTWGEAPKYSQRIASIKARDGKLALTIFAGNNKVRYAHLVEFSTRAHVNGGKFAGSMHPGTKAQPFFFVSWRALRRRTKSRITRAITKSAKQVAAGGGGGG
ncbi:HK97 gp10 family phage protein [Pseudaminobacter arsenicus]|uniref:HK97 gp10 family phage protein n=1 Tax=Borborobacter arsenicus TaxID=1851146 RepID=A0A432VAM3_9HYPH|nr:HK97 gp10 family phage protein [Pseudaminobacter arsenicus]RUM99156.1 HK97 gp10 family phage protein [Pseudaminobacter arsenicus]